MIQPEPYEIEPPAETIQTAPVEKPQPDSDPLPILEGGLLDTSTVGGGKDRAVFFSGGDDSLALCHRAFEKGWADLVVHLATGSSISENIDYIRDVCAEYCWPLHIIKSPMPFEIMAYRYGFPGPGAHDVAFNYLKGRQLAAFARHRKGDVKFISGVRKDESDRRKLNIDAEVEYEDASDGGNFTGWWVSPLMDKPNDWVHDYREQHNLPRNPVAQNDTSLFTHCIH